MSSPKATRISHAFCAILIVQTVCLLRLARCQDGDAEFEAVHQDIGRISGLGAEGSPQVAPKSTLIVRRPQPAHEPSQLASPPANVAQVFEPRGTSSHGRPAGSSRKPQRITLVARRDPLPSTLTTAPAQPSLIAAQLPAPPQQQQQPQQAQQFQPTLAAQEQPSFTASFGPVAPAAPAQFEAQGASSVPLGPALGSFRSLAGSHAHVHTSFSPDQHASPQASEPGSVSARHSALMQQVAAERAAVATLQLGSEAASSGLAPLGLAPPGAHSPAPLQLQPQPARQAISAFAQQAAPSTAQGHALLNVPSGFEEPLVAPSFEHVLGHGCPRKGVFSWENKDSCDRYYMCTNGTFTEEACPNGLAYSQLGAVYQHCAYNWNVDCGRKKSAEPIASPGCPWQFGLFPIVQNGRCSIDYYACEWGVPETKRCSPEGLFYDDRIKGCQWADQLGCKSEALLNFKCPAEDEDNPYWPYPRYYHNTQDVIVCVNEQPRLVHCNEDQLVDPSSLACVDVKPKKKKF